MAILQVYQAIALKDLHEGSPDPEVMQELCTAPNYPLWATKVTTQPLDLSTLVVQEHHLWLNLAKMRDAEKVCFLDAPIVHCRVDLPLDFLRVTLSACISTKLICSLHQEKRVTLVTSVSMTLFYEKAVCYKTYFVVPHHYFMSHSTIHVALQPNELKQ